MKLVIKSLLLSGAFLVLTATNVFAEEEGSGLFLEPGVGYHISTATADYPNAFSSSTATMRGGELILRGGLHILERVFIAVDGRYGLMEYSDRANDFSSTGSSWNLAPTVGWQMKDSGVRIYGGYIVAGQFSPGSSNNTDFRLEDPRGWRVGAGLKLDHFSINLEWQKLDFNSTSYKSGGLAGGDIRFRPGGLNATVTFPIEFK